MNRGFTSIPFKTETAHGLKSINGVAKFSAAGIVLEFESKLFGIISDGVKEAQLSIGDILDVRFKKGFLKRGAKIEVRPRSLMAFNKIPNEEGKLILKVKAEDFESARDAVLRMQKDLGEFTANLPPTHTPVSLLFDESEDETKKLLQ
ncbi:MAG TPA: hypothetical protein PKA82_11945 [Pyrinomonadaceae bacterium]|nr:hypothetical protein [Pyrinomonadaceae bacterium]